MDRYVVTVEIEVMANDEEDAKSRVQTILHRSIMSFAHGYSIRDAKLRIY